MLSFPGSSFDYITTYFENPFSNYHNIYRKLNKLKMIPFQWIVRF